MCVLQRRNSGDGCDLSLTLCRYDLMSCSDCVGVCGIVWCVTLAGIVKDSV